MQIPVSYADEMFLGVFCSRLIVLFSGIVPPRSSRADKSYPNDIIETGCNPGPPVIRETVIADVKTGARQCFPKTWIRKSYRYESFYLGGHQSSFESSEASHQCYVLLDIRPTLMGGGRLFDHTGKFGTSYCPSTETLCPRSVLAFLLQCQ